MDDVKILWAQSHRADDKGSILIDMTLCHFEWIEFVIPQDVQTELYLEELSDRVEEADVECQTDAFLDRPPSPLFIPAKTGTVTAVQ